MKQGLEGNLLSPLPVALVGAMVNGHPNYLVGGDFDFYRLGERISQEEG